MAVHRCPLQKEFLEEMRLEYNRRDQASESLTKKANNLMTVSGIIATLIMGLYGSLYDDTEQFAILGPPGILLFSVIAMITVVIYCVMMNKVEFQRTVFLGKNLVDNSTPNPKTTKSWTDSSKDDCALIDEYVLCLHRAEDVI